MATVRASCESCGTVFVPAAAITVRMAPEETEGHYEFCCPSCFTLVVRVASSDTAELLRENGARIGERDIPAELSEHHDGAAICHNDLIDFHEMISSEERWHEALNQLVDAPNA